jgi:hypothetical protein
MGRTPHVEIELQLAIAESSKQLNKQKERHPAAYNGTTLPRKTPRHAYCARFLAFDNRRSYLNTILTVDAK